MPTTIYFIRHAKTKNPHHIVKGILPGFNLTQDGQREVKKLGKYLAKQPVQIIYYSPLARTKQTAQLIQHALPQAKLIPDKRLLEWQTSWEGKTIKQIQADPLMKWDLYYTDPLKFKTKLGTTARQVVKEMTSFVAEIVNKYPNQTIIAASHGDPIKLLRCYLETGEISRKFIDYPCSQPSATGFVFNNGHYKKTIYKSFIKHQPYFTQ